jgi:hypothetical protein
MSGRQTSFRAYIKTLHLDKTAAQEAQRIGTLPGAELEKAFADSRENDILCTYDELIDRARPYWYKASRRKKHRKIKEDANAAVEASEGESESFGPFPLI